MLNLRGLSFYLQRTVTVVDENADDIRPGIPSRPSGFIASVGSFEQRWRNALSAIVVWTLCSYRSGVLTECRCASSAG